jgi:transcriptional regulator with XRE-family HTH domain
MTSQFAAAIREAMEREDLTLGELKELLGTSYEYTRRLRNGLAFPSKLLLKEVCKTLKLNPETMRSLIIKDRLQQKYGGVPSELTGKSDRVAEIERQVEKLTPEQFEQLKGFLQVMVRTSKETSKT